MMAERHKEKVAAYNTAAPLVSTYVDSPASMASEVATGRDLEKKGRRRPGRRGRQDSDGVLAPCNNGAVEVAISSADGLNNVTSLRSPSPSYMPNPKFGNKSATGPIVSLTRPSARLERSSSDLAAPSSFTVSGAACIPVGSSVAKSGSGGRLEYVPVADLKSRSKESSPVQTTIPKWKEAAKTSKWSNDLSFCGRSSRANSDSKSGNFQRVIIKSSHVDTQKATSGENCGYITNPRLAGTSSEQLAAINSEIENRSSREMLDMSYFWPGPRSNRYLAGSPATSYLKDKACSSQTFRRGEDGQTACYPPYLPFEKVSHALKAGQVFRAKLRVNMYNRNEAYISLEGLPTDILIDGLRAQNRAIDGDVVAVALNPVSYWPKLRGSLNKQNSDGGLTEMLLDNNDPLPSEPQESSSDGSHFDPVETTKRDLIAGKSFEEGIEVTTANPSSAAAAASSSVKSSSYPERSLDSRLDMGREDKLDKEFGHIHSEISSEDINDVNNLMLKHKGRAGDQTGVTSVLGELATLVTSLPDKRPTGKILAILEKSPRREAVIGFLEVQQQFANKGGAQGSYSTREDLVDKTSWSMDSWNNARTVTIVPSDSRFPKMAVFVNTLPDNLRMRLQKGDPTVNSELVAARIDQWRDDSFIPYAVISQPLGQGGEIEAQTAAILFEYAIHSAEFPGVALADLPELPWKISAEELTKRRDLRGSRIFTIDPPTARDLDDALSIEYPSNNIVRIGVHIADVSFFVRPDTALDKEAQDRSTSVYLIQHVFPMLPQLLCEELCSLNPGIDRLAFSVVWDLSTSGEIIDHWIGRTVIRSCCKLTYGHAQDMIDGTFSEGPSSSGALLPELHGGFNWNEVIDDVKALHKIAKRRGESRFEAGALRLQNSKLVFALDEDGIPYESTVYKHKDSNFLVEEFMLLANMTVAKVISSAFPDCALLRRHPEPNTRKLKDLEDFCSKNGFELDVSSAGALHNSLQKLREDLKDDPALCSILMLYATKPMQLAKYFCTGELKDREDNWAHYALATRFYTHFTSPIRRYPDIVVHRSLAAVLEAEKILCESCLPSTKMNEFQEEGSFPAAESTPKGRCFTGPTLDKETAGSLVGQKALATSASKHKVPCCTELAMVAEHCNERKLASRNVKEATDRLYLWAMLKKKQGVLSDARVLALGPKFVSLYVSKIAMERRIYYDEIEGLKPEWFEGTGTLVLDISSQKGLLKKNRQGKHRTFADVALLVNPADRGSVDLDSEKFVDVVREVQERLQGNVQMNDETVLSMAEDLNTEKPVEPAVLPLTLRPLSHVPVSVYAVGGEKCPLDIAVRFYLSSYLS